MSKGFGISRLDLMKGHNYHYSIDEEMENGLLVEINYAEGKVAPTTDPSKKQHYLSSVTNLYDSMDEGDFINKPDAMEVRVYTFEVGDIFTTTQIEGDHDGIEKGDYGVAAVGGKFAVSGSAPANEDDEGDTVAQVFRVVETDYLNGQPAVVFQVEKA